MNIIVGTGLAAVRAVQALREAGSSAPIVMVGAERVLPYDRPPLSKEFLRGETGLEGARMHPPEFFREHDVELLLGSEAKVLHAAERSLELEGGRRLDFEQLLIATGAYPRRLHVEGEHLEGVLTLRTAEDALRLKNELARADRVVVVGAGLIGFEVASVARDAGKHVTILEAARQPLGRVLPGSDLADAIVDLHRAHGSIVRTSAKVAELRGSVRVEEVVLSTGERLRADVVLVAVGVAPATDWLRGSGLRLEDGVLTDAALRTNVAGIYAAGDVARALQADTERHERFEQYGAAQAQGLVAGKAMAGIHSVPRITRVVGSEQFGTRLQVIGDTAGADRVLVRGSREQHTFVALFVVDGHARGAFLMGRPRDLPAVRRLVADGAVVDERRFELESEPLEAQVARREAVNDKPTDPLELVRRMP